MRFLLHEQPYETPIAAGQLHYHQDGTPTGAVEHWRLNQALDGYRFLRVDLDGRSSSGNSYLFHLVIAADGRPERLRFHFWRAGWDVDGNLTFAPDSVTLSATKNGRRWEDDVSTTPNPAFWFPASMGLSLLATAVSAGTTPAVTLQVQDDSCRLLATEITLTAQAQAGITIGRQSYAATPVTVQWQDQARTIWLDEHDLVLKMARPDGLTAVANRYIHYQA